MTTGDEDEIHHDIDRDLERGAPSEESAFSDPFDIAHTKNASHNLLKRWRQSALVLNASRRFRYTLDLKRDEEQEKRRRMIRAHAQVIRVKGISGMLRTDVETGITGDDDEFAQRRDAFGSNTYPVKKGRTFWMFLWDAWQDTTLIILIVAAIASLALGIKTEGIKEGWYDGGSITFAVLLVIIVTATSDYRQSLQFQNLNEEKRNIQVEVIRGGRREKVSIYDIVVGDIIPLKIGDQVPADGLVTTSHSLAIDESSMTGESKIVHKDQKTPFLMSGCKVVDGAGTILMPKATATPFSANIECAKLVKAIFTLFIRVTGVGINTEWGLLMTSISEDNGEETPLQVRLNGVTTFIGIVGLTVAFSVLVILLARYFTGNSKDPDGTIQFVSGKTSLGHTIDGVIHIITAAVTIVVVAVPEGLPLAVTLTLAYSMKKMMADKALVRRLSACETMGSATTICSDKTGTLTLNQMTVVEAYVGTRKIDPPEDSSQLPASVSSLLDEGLAQNTSGSVFLSKDGKVEVSGTPTEKAILQWGVKLGMKFDNVKSESIVLHVSPFNSTKKRGGVAVRRLAGSQVHVHWKGAAEIILTSCSQYIDVNNSLQSIDNDMDFLKDAINTMAEKSLRCVAVAYKTFEADMVPTGQEQLSQWTLPEDDLVLLAIVGIKDPCRPGVREAVELCTHAGVKVRMVTGDKIQTAKAIALECGILSSNAETGEPYVMEGKRFRELPERDREEAAKLLLVMGRSSPNDKLLLVQALRKQGEVVAVTGDGTNDAPALNEADIGLSMGIQGTEVAKESSDIIILDDNFASVVKVVRWGRSVYANIQKFIQFQLTVNAAALTINVVAAISSGDVPLNTVQLLWVNLIMDTLGALALATEPPTDHLIDRSPVGRRFFNRIAISVENTIRCLLVHTLFRESLVTNIMWRNLLIQAIYQISVLLVLNFEGSSLLKLKNDNIQHANMVKNTVVFNAFVLCQIFNEFNARKPDELNVFTGIIIINFLGKFTSTVKLSFQQWLICFLIGIISWPLAVAGKFILVPKTPLGKVFVKPYQQCIAAREART
ncbi:hypothetical protein SASPL_109960 [Salvia splendens]|uniref:Calcium-transporting ATPase n=1 Tax=Salvia splendens TaxID=180675 RepID=A0A8X9A2V8_SALSN|nr:hypothetical protein SASPL_109960 [Salvia splendens]